MKTKYTPGPWHTDSSKSFYVFGPGHLAEQAGVEHGAFVCNASTQANARLIAAAPMLLELLQAIHEYFENNAPYYPSALVINEQIQSAIHAATGED